MKIEQTETNVMTLTAITEDDQHILKFISKLKHHDKFEEAINLVAEMVNKGILVFKDGKLIWSDELDKYKPEIPGYI